jgi:ankyrin repeat protein
MAPIHVAVLNNDRDMVKTLLKQGANLKLTNAAGENVAHLAASIGS